jgi:hypothetical protein
MPEFSKSIFFGFCTLVCWYLRKKIYSFNGKNIKILSWNFGFMYHRMLERRPLLLKELIQSDPDVVLSQNAVIGCESDHVNLLKMANESKFLFTVPSHLKRPPVTSSEIRIFVSF